MMNYNRADMAEARRRENPDSTQPEGRDRMPSRGANHMPRNRLAGDAELDAMWKAVERVPAIRRPQSRYDAERRADEEVWRIRNPKAAMALDGRRREREDEAFYKRFPGLKRQQLAQDSKKQQKADDFFERYPQAERIGFSY